MTISESVKRERKSHVWARSDDDWYVEPEWVSERLFQAEPFEGDVWDPCCGTGRIVQAACAAGHRSYGSDIARRAPAYGVLDFFRLKTPRDNVVCNPPFDIARQFAEHAVRLARGKVAIVFPTARLNAARWLQDMPLRRVWLLTPRPSMPPGSVIMAGEKPGGGKMDFCWLVFGPGTGAPEIRWLHRDGVAHSTEAAAVGGEG